MFAVPGWAVDSTSLVQEGLPPGGNAQLPPSVSTSASKKRKNAFPDRLQASKVSGTELEKLWNQHAGAKAARTEQGHGHQGHDHRNSEQDKAGRKDISATDRKSDRKGNNDESRPTYSARQQSVQNRQRRKAGNSNRRISDDDAGTPFSKPFPRDNITKALSQVLPLPAKLTPLQAKMRNKLTSARFRHLNETLYTTTSSVAMDLFTNSPDLFSEYHTGFSQQVRDSWPVNPVDKYISAIKTRGQIPATAADDSKRQHSGKESKSPLQGFPLPRRKTGLCTIADLGCGDAPLARSCQSVIKALKLKFHNFDLHAPNSLVAKADISSLPLRDGEVDIAIFCLSLMGTNWITFVEEAWRILRGDGKGECWVSEVKSRFGRAKRQPGQSVENSVGKKRKKHKLRKPRADGTEGSHDDIREELFVEDSTTTEETGDGTDISAFVRVFSRRGFLLREESVDKSNKMFVSMVFVKSGVPSAGKYKGLKWNGREYQIEEAKMKGNGRAGAGAGGSGYEGEDSEIPPEEEAKVLKPCVYKTR
ncbi:uncharacterized protein Z519_07867 [Cladophialophora bantiana CBS 173.52]|uniref:Ribosomal RNA-processing protein 8 n=1 Tax=Cladophialophora bantiana (strain ATCC 10958 / CBS 173.52 / CDC B-1940 / NIH 8579) TaxID=1442370 RepID=A0A0D2FZK2_CLAB1|nr:uncharacterized protein Z519_07867 [Cladophialophora bantiana CBS 173.52]KIW91897.1 hypothetical protein Z519_07867 [Cladophialophora bantiana CBS 173.52]